MVNHRLKIEEAHGRIKKIELKIPGFRGYRKIEDLRIADSLLRNHLANSIKNAGETLEGCRNILAKNMKLSLLKDIGNIINKIERIENRVRHAEQGYVGISADFQIGIDELNKLYEWDLKLLGNINKLNTLAITLKKAIDNEEDIQNFIKDLEIKTINFNKIFDKRIQKIAELL